MGNETTNVGVIVGEATSADSTGNGRARFVWDPSSCVRYFQARWVLRQLVFADVLSPQESAQAHIEVAAEIGWFLTDSEIALDPTPIKITRAEVRHKARLLHCASCGSSYGRSVLHSTSKHRAHVYECPINRRKRGTCAPPHIYQEHLGSRMTLLMQMLLKQSDVLDLLTRFLPRRPEITKHLYRFKHESAETLPVYYKDICALILNATMPPTPSIEVRLYDGTALSVPVTPQWTPVMRRS